MTEHKAFVFDFERFSRELQPIIERGLLSGDCSDTIAFIHDNLGLLKDPYEGEPLGSDWESMIETRDVHQYGDFALTKYYDPSADIGLGGSWMEAQDLIARESTFLVSPILGAVLGPESNPFDPGKMGSYFQSYDRLHKSIEQLTALRNAVASSVVAPALQMLNRAADAKAGLYVTF
jgi:hypothetical protein